MVEFVLIEEPVVLCTFEDGLEHVFVGRGGIPPCFLAARVGTDKRWPAERVEGRSGGMVLDRAGIKMVVK